MRDTTRAFAKMAMQAIINRRPYWSPKEVAQYAWLVADAMEAEDERRREARIAAVRAAHTADEAEG